MKILPHTAQERGVFWSIASGISNNVFSSLTMTYSAVFILFLSELGLTKTRIGAIGSLLPFSGLLALFIAPTVTRWGFKRTFVTFWGIRKLIVALLLFTPAVLASFGLSAVFAYVAAIVGAFAICRAIAETAYNPWSQEFVPNAIRGKYHAVVQVGCTIAGFVAVGIATYVMGRVAGLEKFMILIAIGVGFGLLSVLFASYIPGDAPHPPAGGRKAHFREMLAALRDRDFTLYLAGASLFTLGAAAWGFLPLFMREQVGLSAQQVVLLQNGTLLGSVLSGYLWGWAADRYGSKPVMLGNLAVRAILPICWLLMPRHSAMSLYAALAIAFFDGVTSMGWHIGASRLLYVRIVPPEKKTAYLSLHYAWMGVAGGITPLAAGRILDALAGLSGRWLFFTLDAYTILFVAGFALLSVGTLLYTRLQPDIQTVVKT